jgi:hypothetical protein
MQEIWSSHTSAVTIDRYTYQRNGLHVHMFMLFDPVAQCLL